MEQHGGGSGAKVYGGSLLEVEGSVMEGLDGGSKMVEAAKDSEKS